MAAAPAKVSAPTTFETVTVTTGTVACDGGNGGLGHPRIYLDLSAEGHVVCPYCSRTYVLAEGAKVGHGH